MIHNNAYDAIGWLFCDQVKEMSELFASRFASEKEKNIFGMDNFPVFK